MQSVISKKGVQGAKFLLIHCLNDIDSTFRAKVLCREWIQWKRLFLTCLYRSGSVYNFWFMTSVATCLHTRHIFKFLVLKSCTTYCIEEMQAYSNWQLCLKFFEHFVVRGCLIFNVNMCLFASNFVAVYINLWCVYSYPSMIEQSTRFSSLCQGEW